MDESEIIVGNIHLEKRKLSTFILKQVLLPCIQIV